MKIVRINDYEKGREFLVEGPAMIIKDAWCQLYYCGAVRKYHRLVILQNRVYKVSRHIGHINLSVMGAK